MNVLDAMAGRHSARAFSPRRPDRGSVDAILKNAGRAPSDGNAQPWRVVALTGDRLADVVNVAAAADARLAGKPPRWAPEALRPTADGAAARRAGLRFFEAPVGLLCLIPRDIGPTAWIDHGCFVYGITLAAAAFGLATCIIGDFSCMEDILADVAGLDPDRERITVGVGVGFAEQERHGAVGRKDLGEIASFHWG